MRSPAAYPRSRQPIPEVPTGFGGYVQRRRWRCAHREPQRAAARPPRTDPRCGRYLSFLDGVKELRRPDIADSSLADLRFSGKFCPCFFKS
jgi:hypothetical protein